MGFTGFLVAITLVCFLLIIAIMVQNPKGGGLSSSFGGGGQIGGVQKTTDFLDKSTWYLAGALVVLIFLSTLSFPKGGVNSSKIVDESTIVAPAVPAMPDMSKDATTAPAATTNPAESTPATETEKK
ncbi:preprotein translocase subunit SecG [Flavobacterium sp.]|uniref:preprotein translocase subunit SecG n=1 Tax=Flavobacterium sp. TaxID=239 RepID=UPI003F69B0F6